MSIAVPAYKVVVTTQRRSGKPEDAVMNTWHYIAPSGTPNSTDFGNWMNHYRSFIDSISTSWSGALSNSPIGITVEHTRLPQEKPPPGTGIGPPVSTGALGFTVGPATVGYPAEVSVCITLDAASVLDSEVGAGDTRPAARKRNRKYIGPLSVNTGESEPTTNETRVSSTFRNLLSQKFVEHMVTGMKAAGWAITTFSPTLWQVFPPHKIWVDNAFDTQRRRGEAPTLRLETPTPAAVEGFVDAHSAVGVELFVDSTGNIRHR